jgi:para-nitrobenzyl esterase
MRWSKLRADIAAVAFCAAASLGIDDGARAATAVDAAATVADSNGALVRTTGGKVRGTIDDRVLTFRGIPYARADRFMPPAPTKWTSTFSADRFGATCPQTARNPFPGVGPKLPQSEDCLNLNVWTTSTKDKQRRAVMVWLHGGGFSGGSSMEAISYDGKNLSKKGDVVIVSVNHRLNLLGHLDLSAVHPRYKYSANLGVMDLVASLQWVRANIAKFGGDPNNVTIFGESGGGAKVLTLMATPAAKGLFHKAIVQSGAVEGMGMTLTSPQAGKRVAELTLQALAIGPKELGRLRAVPYAQLADASAKALKQTADEQRIRALRGNGFALDWAPTMDGKYIPVQPVGESFAAQSRNIPLLIGSNLHECETFPELLNRDKLQSDNRNTWTAEQVAAKLKEKHGDKADAVAQAFLQAYPQRKLAGALYADAFLRRPAIKTANLKADRRSAPVYAHLFAWETPAFGGLGGAYHTSEIPFVFDNIAITGELTGSGKEAFALADQMSLAWIGFAKTGQPSTANLPRWLPYTRENGATMVFDGSSELKYHHDAGLLRLLPAQ